MKFNLFTKYFSNFSRFFLVLTLAGCANPCADACQTDVLVGQDRNVTHPQALAETADAFVDGRTRRTFAARPVSTSAGAPKAAAGGFILIDPKALNPGSDTLFQVQQSRSLALRHTRSFRLNAQDRGYAAVTLALGETRYSLPKGMGVLTDPTQISMHSLSLQPELGAARNWLVPGGRLRAAIAGGAQISVTDTSVQSALLNVRYRATPVQPYAALRLSVQPTSTRLSAELEARVSRDGLSQIRTDLRVPLGRN